VLDLDLDAFRSLEECDGRQGEGSLQMENRCVLSRISKYKICGLHSDEGTIVLSLSLKPIVLDDNKKVSAVELSNMLLRILSAGHIPRRKGH
jgi:hypothetical protein